MVAKIGLDTAWDAYDAYLFDIDGTLLRCEDAVHYFAFCNVMSGIAGHPINLDGVTTHGNVDIGIIRDAFLRSGVPESVWRPQLSDIRKEMSHFVETHSEELRITVMPAVRQTIIHLRALGACIGVATGNLEAIGRAKLNRSGLLGMMDFGGYSDAHEYRKDVFAHALAKAQSIVGEEARVCVVGDTPEDVRSARANRLDVVAVGTGMFSVEELQAASPNRCAVSFAEILYGESRGFSSAI